MPLQLANDALPSDLIVLFSCNSSLPQIMLYVLSQVPFSLIHHIMYNCNYRLFRNLTKEVRLYAQKYIDKGRVSYND
jgi:hypothetical protein